MDVLQRHTTSEDRRACSGKYAPLGMDALVIRTNINLIMVRTWMNWELFTWGMNIILVWAWMLWELYASGMNVQAPLHRTHFQVDTSWITIPLRPRPEPA